MEIRPTATRTWRRIFRCYPDLDASLFVQPHLVKRIGLERQALRAEAKEALAAFRETGRSNIDWGRFIPRAELNNCLLDKINSGHPISAYEARERDNVWTNALEKYSRRVARSLRGMPDDPIKKFQKAFDYLSVEYLMRYRYSRGSLFLRLEGKGGNCEAQAKLFLALVDKIYDWQKSNWQPAVANYPQHLEVVLYNQETGEIYEPSFRRALPVAPTAIVSPHIFARAYLLGQGGEVADARQFVLKETPVMFKSVLVRAESLINKIFTALVAPIKKRWFAFKTTFNYDVSPFQTRNRLNLLGRVALFLLPAPVLKAIFGLYLAISFIREWIWSKLPRPLRMAFGAVYILACLGLLAKHCIVPEEDRTADVRMGDNGECLDNKPVRTYDEMMGLAEKLKKTPHASARPEEIREYIKYVRSLPKAMTFISDYYKRNPAGPLMTDDEYEQIFDILLTKEGTTQIQEMKGQRKESCSIWWRDVESALNHLGSYPYVPGLYFNAFAAWLEGAVKLADYKDIRPSKINVPAHDDDLMLAKLLRADRILLDKGETQKAVKSDGAPFEVEIDIDEGPAQERNVQKKESRTGIYYVNHGFFIDSLFSHSNYSIALLDKLGDEDAVFVREQLIQMIKEKDALPFGENRNWIYMYAGFLTPRSKANEPLRKYFLGLSGMKRELALFYLYSLYSWHLLDGGFDFNKGSLVYPSIAPQYTQVVPYSGLDSRDPLLKEAKEIYLRLVGEPKPAKKDYR